MVPGPRGGGVHGVKTQVLSLGQRRLGPGRCAELTCRVGPRREAPRPGSSHTPVTWTACTWSAGLDVKTVRKFDGPARGAVVSRPLHVYAVARAHDFAGAVKPQRHPGTPTTPSATPVPPVAQVVPRLQERHPPPPPGPSRHDGRAMPLQDVVNGGECPPGKGGEGRRVA